MCKFFSDCILKKETVFGCIRSGMIHLCGMKIHPLKLFSAVIFFSLFQCRETDPVKPAGLLMKPEIFSWASVYLDSGDCVRISNSGKTTCTSLSRSQCSTSLLILTKEELSLRSYELLKYKDRSVYCETPLISSGLLSAKVTSQDEKRDILSKNIYLPVSGCTDEGFSSSVPVFGKEELKFLMSNSGKFGEYLESTVNLSIVPPSLSKLASDAKECYRLFSDMEKEILSLNRKQEKLKEYSCSASSSDCPAKYR